MEAGEAEFAWKRDAKNMTRLAIRSYWEIRKHATCNMQHATCSIEFDSSKPFVALNHRSLPKIIITVINNLTSTKKMGIEAPIDM